MYFFFYHLNAIMLQSKHDVSNFDLHLSRTPAVPEERSQTGFLAANDLSPHYSIIGGTMIAFQ